VETFRKPFLEAFKSKGQLVDIRPIMGTIKWLIFSTLVKRLAARNMEESGSNAYVIVKDPKGFLVDMEIPNRLGAFVYLIDRQGLIRWKASGEAAPEELEQMLKITSTLLSES